MRLPDSWNKARATVVLAFVTAAAWLLVSILQLQDWATIWGGFIPARIAFGNDDGLAPFWLTPLTATLVHAGFIHLAFNLLIQVFCGRPVESVLGPASVVILYLVGAYAAAGAQYLVDPLSPVPMVGASGAISAIIGAYAMLFGRNKVRIANPRLAMWLNALWLLAAWVGINVLTGLTFATGGLHLAVAAHIGGFLVGVLLANPLLLFRYRRA